MNIKNGQKSRVSEVEDTHRWPFTDFGNLYQGCKSLHLLYLVPRKETGKALLCSLILFL